VSSTPAALGTASPWTRADVIRAAAVVGLGCAVWAIGWYRVANEGAFDSQIAPLNVAVLGLVVACAAHLLWFLGGRRAVDFRRRLVLGDDAAPAERVTPAAELESYVGGERLYHRPECPMAQNRDWVASSRVEQKQSGRVPCGWCAP
jgi:hypothetical protein